MYRHSIYSACLVFLLVAPAHLEHAHADEAPLDLNRFHPALGTNKILTTDLATVGPSWQLVPQLFLHYADRPLVLTLDGDYERDVVRNRVTGELGISLSIKGRVELGLSMPVTLTQSGDPLGLMPLYVDGVPVNPPDDIAGTGLEDLRLSIKGGLLRRGPYVVGALARVSIPTGDSDSYLGSASPTFDARLMAHMQSGRFIAGVALGGLFASTKQVLLTRTGSALTFSAGVEYQVFERETTTVSLATEFFGLAHTRFETSDETPLELLFAAKARRDDWTMFVGAGPGLTPGYGEPRVRVLAGISYAYTPPKKQPKPPEEEEEEVQPPPPPPPPPEDDDRDWGLDSTITLPSGLLFEYDRCAILPESYSELRKLADNLAAHPEWGNVRVDGHASEEGTSDDQYNLRLSRCRAQRIAEFLEFYGVAKERLSYLGFGYRCPRAPNDTEEGRSQNRRVDFVRNPETNLPSCAIPPQLEPLAKHAEEPRPYRDGKKPKTQPKPGPGPTQPPASKPPATTPPAGQPPAATPPTGTPPAAQPSSNPAATPASPAPGAPKAAAPASDHNP